VAEIEGLWTALLHARRPEHRARLLDELGRAGDRLAALAAATAVTARVDDGAGRPAEGIVTSRAYALHVRRRCAAAAGHVDWIIEHFGPAS
jgi:hypothetical protein